MKDLRFKIIADFVKGGFDRAEQAVGSLKGKFREMFDGQRAGWARVVNVGTAAGIAIAGAIRAAVASIKASWMDAMDTMERGTADFAGNSATFFRKAGRVSTQQEKDKLIEQTRDQMRALKLERDRIDRENATDSPLDEIIEAAERVKNQALGLGLQTNDELRLKQINEQLKQYNGWIEKLDKIQVKSLADDFGKELEKVTMDAQRYFDTKDMSPQDRETYFFEAKKLAEEDLAKAQSALLADPNNELAAEAAKAQLDVVKELTSEWRSALEALDEYERGLSTAGKDIGAAKPAVVDTEDAAYAFEFGDSLTRSNVGFTRKDRKGGLSGRRGDRLTNFRMPAHLQRAIESREGATGAANAQQDPMLLEMKEQTRILEAIEKKSGMAP